ncbi:MAG: prepilin-type N-terminal cleavage/methylation domain-containing protein [Mariprofundus sp.]
MKRNHPAAGFTLVEILVTLVIVSVAALAIGSFTVAIQGGDQVSRERGTAVSLAEQLLEFWQQDPNDHAPRISTDCSLVPSAATPSYPIKVTCTPATGMKIPYDIEINYSPAIGPLSKDLNNFKTFDAKKRGSVTNVTAHIQFVKISWSNQGKSHFIYLTNLSKVQ